MCHHKLPDGDHARSCNPKTKLGGLQTIFFITARSIVWCALCASVLVHSQSSPITLAYQLTHSETVDPSLSPDGKRMVYITVIAGKEQLFAMNLDGSDPRQL